MSVSPLLGLGIALAGVPGAIGKSIEARRNFQQAQQDRADARAQAELRKQQSQLQLQALQHSVDVTQPLQAQQLQQTIQLQQQKLDALEAKDIKQRTINMLDSYFQTGDVSALDTFFADNKDNPRALSAFSNTTGVRALNFHSMEDRSKLLAAAEDNPGMKAELDLLDGKKDGKISESSLDWDKVQRRFLVARFADSTGKPEQLVDILSLVGQTGYARYARKESLNEAIKLADLAKTQQSKDKPLAFEQKATLLAEARAAGDNATPVQQEMIRQADSAQRTPTEPTIVREAKALAAAKDRIAAGKAEPGDQALVRLEAAKTGGVAAAKQSAAETARAQFRALGFDKLSQEELQATPKARELVNQIELAHGISQAQQKELVELNSLIDLSSAAGQLSDAQTGLLDKLTSNATSYVNDEVGTKQAKASYGAFINQFRHNLFGSALTTGELEAFRTAYGDLGQKSGPVLAGLKAALQQVKSKLTTISDLNDPYVIKFRTGRSVEEVHKVLRTLDARIQAYDAIAAGADPAKVAKQLKTTANATKSSKPPSKESMLAELSNLGAL